MQCTKGSQKSVETEITTIKEPLIWQDTRRRNEERGRGCWEVSAMNSELIEDSKLSWSLIQVSYASLLLWCLLSIRKLNLKNSNRRTCCNIHHHQSHINTMTTTVLTINTSHHNHHNPSLYNTATSITTTVTTRHSHNPHNSQTSTNPFSKAQGDRSATQKHTHSSYKDNRLRYQWHSTTEVPWYPYTTTVITSHLNTTTSTSHIHCKTPPGPPNTLGHYLACTDITQDANLKTSPHQFQSACGSWSRLGEGWECQQSVRVGRGKRIKYVFLALI